MQLFMKNIFKRGNARENNTEGCCTTGTASSHNRAAGMKLNIQTLLSACCALILVSGCATSNKISQDFKPDTDFKVFKTFAWHNFASEIPNTNNSAIKNAIEQSLSQQGFQLVNEAADIVVDMNIITQQSTASSPRFGLSLGLPIGNHGSIGLGTSKLLGSNNSQEGLIIIDITATATNQAIWRGTAEAIPMSHFLLRNERQLNAVLKNLIAQFPPNK